MTPHDPLLSAQVIVRPRSGPLTGHETITSENVAQYLPDPGHVSATAGWFARSGFEVRDALGLGFSIVAAQSTFERVFGVSLPAGESQLRPLEVPREGLALPLDRLPGEIAMLLQAVQFPPPPEFGPTDY